MLIIGFIISVSITTLGLVVMFYKIRDIANLTFGVFAMSVAVWVWSVSAAVYLPHALFWGRLAISSSVVFMASLLLFALTFPDRRKIPLHLLFVISVPALFFGVIAFTPLLVKSVLVSHSALIGNFGPLMGIYRLYPPIYIFSALFVLFRKYAALTGLKKMQLKYSLVGMALALIPGVFTNAILPAIGIYALNGIGPLFSIIMVAFISYAILRHSFLDIRFIIQRGFIYTSLLALVVFFYLVLVTVMGTVFQDITHTTILLSGAVTTVSGIFGVPFLDRYLRRVTDKVFFKGQYDYAKAMHEFGEIMNKNLDLKTLLQELVDFLKKTFRLGNAYILVIPDDLLFGIPEGGKKIEKVYSDRLVASLEHDSGIILSSEISHSRFADRDAKLSAGVLDEIRELCKKGNIEVIVPIVSEQKLLAVLALGPKLSGDAYAVKDLSLLKTLSFQLAVALKKAELYQQVTDYSHKLEARVSERTAELRSLQEEQKQMMLDISHELQTPLTVLKGELESIRRTGPDVEKIAVFERSIDRIAGFIYSLLKLARLETVGGDFSKERICFSDLADAVLEYVGVICREQGIQITRRIERGIMIMGDRSKIEELVTNILSNAIKYMAHCEQKQLTVEINRKGKMAEFHVRDTGAGITVDDLPNIFNRFYRMKRPGDKPVEGTGLGLAIAKRIVEMHGGRITVESTVGAGTAFTVEIPLSE